MIGARSRPPGPLLRSLFRKPCRFTSGCCFLGPSSVDVGKNPLSGLLITGQGIFYALQRTTAKRPTAAPAGQKQPGAIEAHSTQAEAAATAEGQADRRERDSDQPNTPPARQTSHQTRPDSGTRHATLNKETPPETGKRWAGEPPQGGTPATFSPTPQTARRQGRRRGGPDFLARQQRRLSWPCRRVGWGVSPPRGRAFPSFPLAGGPLKLSFRKALCLPVAVPHGERTAAHPAPIPIKAAARVGRTAFRFSPALPGGAGACFSEGQTLPAGAYA